MDVNIGTVTYFGRSSTRTISIPISTPTQITSFTFTSAVFRLYQHTDNVSGTKTVNLDDNVIDYQNQSASPDMNIQIALTSSTNNNILDCGINIFDQFGTTHKNYYSNNFQYSISVYYTIGQVSDVITFYFTISDSWGPVIMYFRRNGSSHSSTPTTTQRTMTGGIIDIQDYNDYYTCIYKYSDFSNRYANYPIVEEDMIYSGHYLAGWTKGIYSSGEVWFSGDMDWYRPDLPYYKTDADIEYVGAVWGENNCPKMYTSDSTINAKKALLMRVLTDNGWVAPQAVYVYNGTTWVQAQNSG